MTSSTEIQPPADDNRPDVTVVTPTRDRGHLLHRALQSVRDQVGILVEHVVVGDDCPHLADSDRLSALRTAFPNVLFHNVARSDLPADLAEYLPSRLSYLRNLGFALGTGRYVAHLDDDNAFEPEHLVHLVRLLDAEPNVDVAHSWRRLVTTTGEDYVPDGLDPWMPDASDRATSYRRLADLGVFEPGSAVVKDRLYAGDQPVGRVDTGEFLIRRSFFAEHPFPTVFSRGQQLLEITEDMAFSLRLVRSRVRALCTERASLIYTMGGYSNADAVGGHADSARRRLTPDRRPTVESV